MLKNDLDSCGGGGIVVCWELSTSKVLQNEKFHKNIVNATGIWSLELLIKRKRN